MAEDKPRHQAHSEEASAKRALQAKFAERRKREEARVRIAVAAIGNTPAGKTLFAYLFNLCGYNRSSIAVDPTTGDVQTLATQHNEAMRLVYIKLRAKLPADLRAEIEAAAEQLFDVEDNKEEKN